MQRRFSWAAALVVILLGALGAGGAKAQELPPRPTPIAAPADQGGDGDEPATGTITGTVIDETTGAPAAGVPVQVGDLTVVSDQSGNYWRDGLAPGSYQVALALPAERGVASQGALRVELAAGARVVQHLAFRSAGPVQPAAAPAPDVAPVALPRTAGDADSAPMLLALAAAVGGLGAWLRRRRSL